MNKPAGKPAAATPIDRFTAIVGEKYSLREASAMAPFLTEQRDLYHGCAAAVLRPGSTEEVAAIVKLAQETRTPIVPQGGNTGLVGAQTPFDERAIVISTQRLDKIREIDVAANTMTCESGVVLQRAQEARGGQGSLLPALARRRGLLHHRRKSFDQCRRPASAVLRRRARPRARVGGGARRRAHLAGAAQAQEGQYRLRPAPSFRRRGRHAWHHHRGGAEAFSRAAHGRDRGRGAREPQGRACAADARAIARRKHGHHVRVDAAHFHRVHREAPAGRARPAR